MPGAGTNKLPALKASERHAKVITLRSKGLSWATIATQVGLKERACRYVWKRWVDEGKIDVQQTDAVAVVVEQIARLDVDIETLAGIAENGDNSSAKVGAIKAKAQLMHQQLELLQAVGLMPKNLGKLSVEMEVRFVAQQMLVLLQEFVPKAKLPRAEERLLELLDRDQALVAAAASN